MIRFCVHPNYFNPLATFPTFPSMFNPPPENENPSWFQAYKAGDADRYIGVFQEYYRPIYVYALKVLGDGHPDLDDVVNTAFTLAWEARDQIESPKHLRNYLYQVVRHRSTSAFRAHHASRKIAKRYLSKFNDTEAERPADLERVWSEVLDAVQKRLQYLPNGHILRMAYIDGLSTKQIASILDTTENNVYIMKSRAIKRLRDDLGKKFPVVLVLAALSILLHRPFFPRAFAYSQKNPPRTNETVFFDRPSSQAVGRKT